MRAWSPSISSVTPFWGLQRRVFENTWPMMHSKNVAGPFLFCRSNNSNARQGARHAVYEITASSAGGSVPLTHPSQFAPTALASHRNNALLTGREIPFSENTCCGGGDDALSPC